jgi:hypothetical protein
MCMLSQSQGPPKTFETVEIIVDEQGWIPDVVFTVDKRVPVKNGYEETELKEQMKKA